MRKLFLVLVVLLLVGNIGFARSFDTEYVEIVVNILDDGIIEIQETLKINFDGIFTEGFREIKLSNSQLELVTWDDVIVTEDGKETDVSLETVDGGKIIHWDVDSIGKRTYVLKYKLKNILIVYDDVVDFNYKVWGDEWATSIGRMMVSVSMPEKSDEFLRWGHPNLGGSIRDEGKIFVYDINFVPKNQWVETRVVFPREMISSTDNVIVKNENGLEKIINEEENYIEEFYIPPEYLIFGPPLLILIIFIYFYWKHGREPKITEKSIYERDIPYGYGPALANSILNWGVNEDSIVATLMDLIRRKYLKVEKVKGKKFLFFGGKDDYEFSEGKKSADDLIKFEKMIFDMIYDNFDKGKIRISELNKIVISKRKYMGFFDKWKKEVEKELKKINLIDRSGEKKFWGLAFLIILGCGFVGVVGGSYFISSLYPLIIGTGICVFELLILLFFKGALPKRNDRGAQHYYKWKNLKKFLKDFGMMKEKVPMDLILWEQFLVFATAFGISSKVIKEMDISLPEAVKNRSTLYVGGSFRTLSTGSFRSSFSSMSMSSSRTGHSGSFSGGGGGGFGGGGGGFR